MLAGLVLLAAMSGAAVAVTLAGSQIQRAPISGLSVPEQPHPAAHDAERGPDIPPVVNVLLVGLDSRDGLTSQQRDELSSGDFAGARADTIMLAQLRTDGSAGALLSFPRDLKVTRCDGSVGRINAAYEIGQRDGEGGSCLVETVHDLSGIAVHHYVELDFAGFVDVIDALGGLELCLPQALRDERAGLDLAAGCQHVDSTQALAFVRARSIDDDFGRIERQQQLLKALLDETTAAGLGSDVPRTVRVLRQVSEAVRADEDLGLGLMRDLATSMHHLGSERLATYHVPADPQMIGGVAYVIQRDEEAAELYGQFRDSSVLDKAAAAAD